MTSLSRFHAWQQLQCTSAASPEQHPTIHQPPPHPQLTTSATRCVPVGAALDSSSLQQLLATLLASYPSFRPSLEQYVLLTDKLAAALLAQLQAEPGSAALPQLLQACTTALHAFADMAAAHPAPKKVRLGL
jgi:hypothetical protein